VRRALALVAVVVALACCGAQERPEGIVERWLLSLNQGAAGRPEIYANDEVSQQVLPRWQDLDPGELDVIEVGRATCELSMDAPQGPCVDFVPFRIVTVDGDEVEGLAGVEDDRIGSVALPGQMPTLPSEGGPSPHDPIHAAGWLLALAVAGILIACSWALMTAVRRRSRTTG
jgi:hypothetical protein